MGAVEFEVLSRIKGFFNLAPEAHFHVGTISAGCRFGILLRIPLAYQAMAFISVDLWQRVRDSNPCTGLERALIHFYKMLM
jgi:hypothetical protein